MPSSSQSIDPEALAAILQQSSEGQQAKTETFESFTQSNYGQTLTLLEELDLEEERSLFYSSLMQERIELVSKLCAKDPRACYLIDEYRSMKTLQEPENIESLDVFGHDVFVGYPINLDSFNELPLPQTYKIKVGDQLIINISGLQDFQGTMQVSPMGEVTIPNFGSFSISGITLPEAKEKMNKKILLSYPGSDVFLSINQMKPKSIFVLGNVLNPGGYGVNAFATAINALITSGGFKPNSSLRHIKINSKNKGSQRLDLYDFLIKGETGSDIILEDGDAVLVGGMESSVHVFGEVNRPAIYETKANETVQDAINFALGFTDNASKNNITLLRKTAMGLVETINVANVAFDSFTLQSGDKLIINPLVGEALNNIRIHGAIRNPGEFKYFDGATISDFLNLESDLLDETYTLIAILKRFDQKIRSSKFIKFDLLSTARLENISLLPRDEIFILSRFDINFINSSGTLNALRLTNSESTEDSSDAGLTRMQALANIENVNLVDSNTENKKLQIIPECLRSFGMNEAFRKMITLKIDAVGIETEINGVSRNETCPRIFEKESELIPYLMVNAIPVVGNIRLPAIYPISNKVSPLEVYHFAGGVLYGVPNQNAYEIYRAQSSIGMTFGDLGNTNNFKFLNVRPYGKAISQGYVTLHGEVNFPGVYALEEGETIASLYTRAGGLTSFAYPQGGILTRDSIKEIEKKVLLKAQKDLGEVMTNAAISGNLNQNPTDLVQLIGLMSSLSESDGLGRIVAEMDPNKISSDPTLDIMLEQGDNIYIPKINSIVTIVGNVLNPITVPYNPSFNSMDYVDLAGGFNKLADKRATYIVQPNGISRKVRSNLFSLNKLTPLPGSTIIVPRKANALDTMSFLKSATPILADLAVTAASITAITNNN